MKLSKRGDIWWVTQWDNVKKKQIRVSTGETDKGRATEKAYTLLAPLLTSQTATMVERAAESVMKLRADADKMAAGRIPLADCWRRSPHVSSRKGRPLKPGTVTEYERCWLKFVRYAADHGVIMAEGLTPALVQDFLTSLGSRARVVTFDLGRAMFERLGVKPSPWCTRPAKPQTIHREPLTMDQVAAILEHVDSRVGKKNAAADASEFAVFIRFLLYTGLRLGDAATFLSENFNRETGELSRTMMKTGRRVRFPAHPDLIHRLHQHDEEYLFPSLAKKYLASKTCLTIRIERLLRKNSIAGEPHQYCAHALRTTFASICASQGVPMPVIQSWLGHDCPSITRVYARVEDIKQKRLAMAKFPTLGK